MVNFLDARLPDHFWSKCTPEPNSGCWLWVAADTKGYGRFSIRRASVYAHRHAFSVLVGEIPDGLELDHRCRTPLCCNPDHLEPVTHQVNCARSPTIGRTKIAPSHCSAGHPYDDANTIYRRSRVGRVCRQCSRASWARRKAA
ncbi:MAG: HNH endonuclease [Myxococcota bacterium]|nr:HNH endonuclease [Myxococcota bacterium]